MLKGEVHDTDAIFKTTTHYSDASEEMLEILKLYLPDRFFW